MSDPAALSGPRNECGEGTTLSGGVCVPLDVPADAGAEAACGPGTVLADGLCVPEASGDAGGQAACGPGTVLAGGLCVPAATGDAGPGVRCGPGTELVDGTCRPLAVDAGPGLSCGAGTAEVNGECVPTGGACTGDDDCPRGLYCIDQGCRERVCEPAERRCAADDLEVCDKLGLGWEFRRTCERGCTDGTCVPQVCPPLAVRCDGRGGLETCDPTGLSWEPSGDCEHGCQAGACRPAPVPAVCQQGERRCNLDTLEACAAGGGGWVFVEACDTACVAGSCAAQACVPGTRRCAADALEQCDRRGLGWELVLVCAGSCNQGACVGGGGGTGCPQGTRRCVGDSVELCAGEGAWTLVEVCGSGCQGGACRNPICQPGARQCAGDEVEICDRDGLEWVFRRSCVTGCDRGECLDPVCAPFARRCNALLPQQCDARGAAWIDGVPCQRSCHEGTCDQVPPGGCPPGTARCVGDNREVCSEFFAWQASQVCPDACLAGECVACRPGARRCEEDAVRRCAEDGSAWELVEACNVACVDARCTVCVPGGRRCNGDTLEVCDADGQGHTAASVCLTACRDGACTACRPGVLRCAGNLVQRCSAEGLGWVDVEECGGRCEQGVCAGEAVCEPGARRCVGQDVQVCTPDAAGWLVVQSCMQRCAAGACEGPGCLPFSLVATPEVLPADGQSSTLLVSGLILDVQGSPVPDGSLFTINVDDATLLAADGDPNTPGSQVRSLNGRIDLSLQAPEATGTATVSAVHPVAGRCLGEAEVEVADAGTPAVALDFTSDVHNDAEITTALWDTVLGRIDPFPSDFGGGQDGALVVGGTYNLNQHSQPGRLFPDAVNFQVTALDQASATVLGGVGGVDIGDEVLLINLQGTNAAHVNVGSWELQEIARIDYGANTVFFTTDVRRLYGVGEVDNSDLNGQQVMLQRVPHYTDVTVDATLTADAWSGTRGGVLFFKALGQVTVQGTVDARGRGYRGDSSNAGESYAGTRGSDQQRNYGGGAGETERHGHGSGGGYGTAGGNGDARQGGATYGTPDLDRWFLGSAGGRGIDNYSHRTACHGGGILVIWAGGVAVRGTLTARGNDCGGGGHRGGGGSGGTIFLRGRSLNVGNGRVDARGGSAPGHGGDGRIRLDFFGLAGVTSPAYHPGFAGDTVAVTGTLDTTFDPVETVTVLRAVTDERGGTITFEATNDGGATWHPVVTGETFTFPEAASDLRLRFSFANENLDPLTLNAVALRYTTGGGGGQ